MRNAKAKVKTDLDNDTCTWIWADETETCVSPFSFSNTIQTRLMLFGLKTKLSNTYAGEAIMTAAKTCFTTGLAMLDDGEWSTGSTRVSILARALARVRGLSIEESIDAIAKLDKKDNAKLRKAKAIRFAIATIELEEAEKIEDDDGDILDSMFDDEDDD